MPYRCLPLLILFALVACVPRPHPAPVAEAIAIEGRAIPLNPADPAQTAVGRLRYLGGLWLQSADPRFGGLSGLRWHDGRLYAVSDAGDWFALELREEGERLAGAGPARVRHLTGLDGKPLQGKLAGDAEALNLNFGTCATEGCPPESASIAFERDHRVWTYRLQDGMPLGPPSANKVPRDWLGRLPANGGIEAMAGVDGLGLFVAEELRTASGAARALVLHNGGESDAAADRWDEAEVPVATGFSPTDADYLDGARFLMLFRRFSLMEGVAARVAEVTVIAGEDGRPRITSKPVAAFAPPLNVDNMEGLAIRREGDRVFVYLVSDDNFSGAQRNLLMKFELMSK